MVNFSKTAVLLFLLIFLESLYPVYGFCDCGNNPSGVKLINRTNNTILFEFKNDDRSTILNTSVSPQSTSEILWVQNSKRGKNVNVVTIENKNKPGKMCQFGVVKDISSSPSVLHTLGLGGPSHVVLSDFFASHNTLNCDVTYKKNRIIKGKKLNNPVEFIEILLFKCD